MSNNLQLVFLGLGVVFALILALWTLVLVAVGIWAIWRKVWPRIFEDIDDIDITTARAKTKFVDSQKFGLMLAVIALACFIGATHFGTTVVVSSVVVSMERVQNAFAAIGLLMAALCCMPQINHICRHRHLT